MEFEEENARRRQKKKKKCGNHAKEIAVNN